MRAHSLSPRYPLVHTIWTLTQNLHQTYHQIIKTWYLCGPTIVGYCTQGEIKCVKNPRAPNSITPDACGHILWAHNTTYAHNIRKRTPSVSPNQQNWHHCRPKIARYWAQGEIKYVKNPRAPNSITPDACGHILWSQQYHLFTQYEHLHKTYTKRITKSTKLTPL